MQNWLRWEARARPEVSLNQNRASAQGSDAAQAQTASGRGQKMPEMAPKPETGSSFSVEFCETTPARRPSSKSLRRIPTSCPGPITSTSSAHPARSISTIEPTITITSSSSSTSQRCLTRRRWRQRRCRSSSSRGPCPCNSSRSRRRQNRRRGRR